MILYRKALRDLEESRTVSAAKIKTNASIEYEEYIESKRKFASLNIERWAGDK